MLFNIFLVLISSLAATFVLILIEEALMSRFRWYKFKKMMNACGVPTMDNDLELLGCHMGSYLANKNVQALDERHKKHGPYVAYLIRDLPTISTTDLDLIKRVVLDKASVNVNRIKLRMPMQEIEQDCIFTCEGDQWRKIRRSFAPALRPARFRTPNVINEIDLAIGKLLEAIERKLASKNSVELDMEDAIRRYSLQIVLGCLYKQYHQVNFNLDEPCRWVSLVDHGLTEMRDNQIFRLGMVVPRLSRFIDWLSYNFHPIGRWRHEVLTFIKQQSQSGFEARKRLAQLKMNEPETEIDENNFRLEDGTKFSRNMTDFIVDQFHAGKLTREEFFHSSFLLFGAADKTASDALVHTLYQLGVNQRVQDKLRESIREHGIESEYLSWVTNESLRLNPPGPIGCSRTISESAELSPDQHPGVFLPAGTFVFTPSFTIHRLPEYWGDDADEFKPERWAKASEFHPAQFMPFGAALRGCPGKEFALFEMKMLTSALIENYRLECEPKSDLLQFDSPMFIFNIQNSPLSMKLTRLG